jgi:hypothetical protein
MKKADKKLTLSKETVKSLDGADLKAIAGGWWSESSCYCPPIY